MASIITLKMALEFARFPDPELREACYNAINQINADLVEVGYDMGLSALEACETLEAVISRVENAEADKRKNDMEEFDDSDGT